MRAADLGVEGQSLVGTDQLGIGHVEADIERRREVVLGAPAEDPQPPIVVAVLDRRYRTCGRSGILDGADREVGYWVSTGSEFLWLSLASTAIIHLRVRPRWTEALLLGLSTALLTALVSFLAHFSFQWISVFAYLGLSSLVMLGTRAIWAEGEERKLLLWAFVPGVLFVAFGWLTPPLLRYGQVASPRVLDLYLYSFDASLGFQPSFLIGVAFLKWHLLRTASVLFYLGLSIPIATAYAGQLVRKREAALPVLLALLFCGPIGAAFYGLFPALGPAHLFHQDFPLHPLSMADASRLLLEPIALAGYRNAMPSLHMGWVLLAWWYCRGLSWWTKSVVLVFVAFTVLATLGTGEHYLIDLVVAFPFIVMLLGLFAFSLPWSSRERLLAVFGGLSAVLLWLGLLRFANRVFWLSPVVPWVLILLTVVASVLQRKRLAVAEDRIGARSVAPSQIESRDHIPELVQS